jgi:hypothetical protein
MSRSSWVCACVLAIFPNAAAFGDELKSSPLAEAFAAGPALWGVRLSPDGSRTVQIQDFADGTTFALRT